MKLSFVEICGFRGYQKPFRIDFADRFTIIDGRNGVGKSTIFDAVEFAMTGSLSKYIDAKAAGESVEDYLWWRGTGPRPPENYVSIGFRRVGEDKDLCIRRTRLEEPDAESIKRLEEALCDPAMAPASPLKQLCASSIIRDEHITTLSLDMKEADRYSLLRDALGAIDSDRWISRANQLVSSAKRRVTAAQQEVAAANSEVAAGSRRLDEVRVALVSDAATFEASQRLQAFANTGAFADQLIGPARVRVAEVKTIADKMQALLNDWGLVEIERRNVLPLAAAVEAASRDIQAVKEGLDALSPVIDAVSSSDTAGRAVDLISLITIGRKLGLTDGGCPLCTTSQSNQTFAAALEKVEAIARQLNEEAARIAKLKEAQAKARSELERFQKSSNAAEAARKEGQSRIDRFEAQRQSLGFDPNVTREQVEERLAALTRQIEVAERDIRVLETIRLSEGLERAQRAENEAKSRLARAQDRFGRARKAEVNCQAIHDAARRAASETLDRRLEQVLPLMSELYRRLKPHPMWSDIEYSIRGDVRRFMKLQVGNDLNPQFLFSSGQRRATGLAFLLSVNLSLAWSRWRTILLDDPVQHVDDFRSVHLAELLAKLVADGRQIVCAVEDTALAELLARRLPVEKMNAAKRVTLGFDADGALATLSERQLLPLPRNTVVPTVDKFATG
jgi:chromosome segregation protein